jgi:hypothetical protein
LSLVAVAVVLVAALVAVYRLVEVAVQEVSVPLENRHLQEKSKQITPLQSVLVVLVEQVVKLVLRVLIQYST